MGEPRNCRQDDCLHKDNPDGGDQIRCILCCTWHHIDCVSVLKKDMKALWTCFKCRQIAQSVCQMQGTLNEMQQTQTELLNLIRDMKDQMRDETEQRTKIENELLAVKIELKTANDKLLKLDEDKSEVTTAPKKQTAPVAAPPKPSLLVGTSLLRNVDSQKLNNYEVIAKGGATIGDLNIALSALPEDKSYGEIVIIGGSIDVEKKTAKNIAEDYQLLCVTASLHADKVTICSIPPRIDEDIAQDTQETNSEILNMANREGIAFVDLNEVFLLKNGTVNTPLLHDDGLHLSSYGVDNLLQSCSVKLKDGYKSAYSETRYEHNRPLYFQGHKHPLSNFYPIKGGIHVDGIKFTTSEAVYVYKKALYHKDHRTAFAVQKSETGIYAKRLGDKIQTSESWTRIKPSIMDDILRNKLSVCDEAKKALLDSDDRELIEDTPNKFWGRGTANSGQNTLGKLWMMYRKKLQTNTFTRPRPRRWATRNAQPKCYRCGEPGHLLEKCRKSENVCCWNCGLMGHKQKHCQQHDRRQSQWY